ncbi:MAG: cytochrome C oxidase subunit III [Mesorhizobium sp.]|uniref:cytochrome P460 family protein n=1 Tax=unclassified Mesorhizobium TaxID=325217 RepID=UPI000FCA4EAB|nr:MULTISPECIES: cytochrome P460 family protein [unclassified Mesorhizobium]RUV69737.1 cytochrome C oxidase subunit III [Mesorhizobium sp. M5C.F.Cr.IN.023.01.1.1]RWF87562.1 MAG: cytochrome C oxidase subunit III [Mesorhizobium sp.]RWF92215.1 MAG: cytochrome C oxidase subunit III [Mesorhizobium sp.]RWI42296.1 MAG: cytochrome C oxidase subunit III [Mesorhizobium sp.]RWI48753.1 MAG: cytochrome C oxidase subunit III [Mesorhizobium sp.]
MNRYLAIAAVAALSAALAITCVAIDRAGAQETSRASPIYGVTLPDGYRGWELIAPALEGDPLNELRAVVGNAVALDAYKKGTLPFPDGSVLVKLAWKRTESAEFESASVPGTATTVQVMVKDSKRYASSGGWGFGRFIDGKPADLAQHETCFACHEARVQNHDYVFTRYAP